MSNAFCISCKKKLNCKEICPELWKELPHDQDGRLKGEFYQSGEIFEGIIQKEKDKESGTRKKPKIYGDNLELEG
jgi:hypothetical protein